MTLSTILGGSSLNDYSLNLTNDSQDMSGNVKSLSMSSWIWQISRNLSTGEISNSMPETSML